MIAATKAHLMSEPYKASTTLSVPGMIGVYFGLRICLTFLFFQKDAQTGAALGIVLNLLLIVPVLFYAIGPSSINLRQALRVWPFRFVLLFLLLTLCSISWTEAQSPTVAFGYWTSLAADVILTYLVLRSQPLQIASDSLMKGFAFGVGLLALVAWAAPTMPDLRIGNDDFLSPNVIGFDCAFGVLLCQHLAPQGARWKWLSAALAITLLRSLSKTSIIAFFVAEIFFLWRTTSINRAGKIAIACGTITVLLIFSGLFLAYYNVYTNAGSQAETLTGRTAIWIVAFGLAVEKPWLGHGFHSFHSIVEPFGSYQAWHAHNELLHQFFSYGIAGVVLVIALYLSLFRQIRRTRSAPLNLVAQSILLLVLVRGLTDTERFDLSLPIWMITAISLTLAQHQEARP